jgi:hypothetical protein
LPQNGVDLAPARRRIAPVCATRPIEIARPSRRVDQRQRARIESRRRFTDPLRERIARGPLQSVERDAFENQRAWRRIDDREVEKILADVDPYKWTYKWPAERSGKRPDSLPRGRLYDGPCGCVAPLVTVCEG